MPHPGSAPGGIPDPALLVLVGASGSGKSTWAAARYRSQEIVSSDALRGIVGSGENDLDASADAFSLLEQIVAARVRRGLTVVVDTLGLDAERRAGWLALARDKGVPVVAVVFETPAAVCRARNSQRDRPVPARVLSAQLAKVPVTVGEVAGEGWDSVVTVSDETADSAVAQQISGLPRTKSERRDGLGFVLQISRFPWGDDPCGWLRAVALAADEAGFEGIALMDHLIQIPQVGRAWDPIPEPWVTLGMLSGLDTRLRLGTLVSPVTFRPAGITAKTVATLDAISGGRAFLGIGAGWWEREHLGFGLRFPGPRERFDHLETSIETIRALWSSGTKAYAGQRVSLPETTAYPRPVSEVPIIVGGSGEQRTLRIAARLGDGCNVSSDLTVLDHKLAVLDRHLASAGRDRDGFQVTVLDLPVVGADRDDAWSKVERLRGRTAAAAYARRHGAGTVSDHIERFRVLAGRGVSTAFLGLPDLSGPDDVLALSPLTAAFR